MRIFAPVLLIIQWLESHLMPCMYQQFFGIACPGCGFQRAFIALLKGEVAESIMLYPPLLPMLAMFIYLAMHIGWQFKHGALVLKIMFFFASGLIVVNYIYKLTV